MNNALACLTLRAMKTTCQQQKKHFHPRFNSADFRKANYENAQTQINAVAYPCSNLMHSCDLDRHERWNNLLRALDAAVQPASHC